MCEKCLPDVEILAVALYSEHVQLRQMFPDPAPLVDPDEGDESPGTDLRVQVWRGGWCVHTGSAQYDLDHRGIWACSWLPWELMTPSSARELAKELLDELADELAQIDTGKCP